MYITHGCLALIWFIVPFEDHICHHVPYHDSNRSGTVFETSIVVYQELRYAVSRLLSVSAAVNSMQFQNFTLNEF